MRTQPYDPTRAERHFDRGLFQLDQYLFHFDDAALPQAVDAFRLATTLGQDNADHWVALGFSLDAADATGEALLTLQQAQKVNPHDEEIEIFALTLLPELGPEFEAIVAVEALAERKGVDLDLLRRDLAEVDLPVDSLTLLLNGFLRARNFVRSRLEDSIERSRRTRNPEQWSREIESKRRECREMQEELQSNFDLNQVPVELRDDSSWAIRIGVGDDVCRSMLMKYLTADEHAALSCKIQKQATSIHTWLDEFENEPMTTEAAAFMNLLLALEEMDTAVF